MLHASCFLCNSSDSCSQHGQGRDVMRRNVMEKLWWSGFRWLSYETVTALGCAAGECRSAVFLYPPSRCRSSVHLIIVLGRKDCSPPASFLRHGLASIFFFHFDLPSVPRFFHFLFPLHPVLLSSSLLIPPSASSFSLLPSLIYVLSSSRSFSLPDR